MSRENYGGYRQSQLKHQIFVGYLPDHATMTDVEELFKPFGAVKTINLKPGFGFVTMEDPEDAEAALKELKGAILCGQKIDIQAAKGPGNKAEKKYEDRYDKGSTVIRDDRNGGYRKGRSRSRSQPRYNSTGYRPKILTDFCLKVSNLTTRASWQDLKDFIRQETDVETAFCEAHRVNVREGLVALRTQSDMRSVYRRCDRQLINGKEVRFHEMQLAGGSSSRSKSRSRSPVRRPRRS